MQLAAVTTAAAAEIERNERVGTGRREDEKSWSSAG